MNRIAKLVYLQNTIAKSVQISTLMKDSNVRNVTLRNALLVLILKPVYFHVHLDVQHVKLTRDVCHVLVGII